MVRSFARSALASVFISDGVDVIRDPDDHAEVVADLVEKATANTSLPTSPALYVRASGAAMVGGGLLLASGKLPRVAGVMLAGLMLPITALGYQFWKVRDPQERKEVRAHFMRNTALIGAALIASSDQANYKKYRRAKARAKQSKAQ